MPQPNEIGSRPPVGDEYDASGCLNIEAPEELSSPEGFQSFDHARVQLSAARYWLVMSLVVVGLSVILRFEPPAAVVVPVINWQVPESCWTVRMFGKACPGCGLTRSFILAAHFHWRSAWQMHPAGTILFGLVVMQIPFRGYQIWLLRRRSLLSTSLPNRIGILPSNYLLIAGAIGLLALSLFHWSRR